MTRTIDAYELPENPNPPGEICFKVRVPDDPAYIRAFKAQIEMLSYWWNWDRDVAHTARLCARRWFKVWNDLVAGNCDEPSRFGAGNMEYESMIRQNPTNPCLIETSADGIHWCAFIDLSLCLAGSGQPGPSKQPPPSGGQECYTINFQASSLGNVPTVVNTGDVVTLQSAQGAGASNLSLDWQCVDGEAFFAGLCSGGGFYDAGDPLPTAKHGALIFKIAGVYYYLAVGSSLTVPAGVVNEPVFVQRNDALTGASGSYQVQVCVTNNKAGTWCHSWDLKVNSGPLVPFVSPFAEQEANWVAGQGWEPTDWHIDASNYYRGCQLTIPVSTTITSVSMTFDRSGGDYTGAGGDTMQALAAAPVGFLAQVTKATAADGAGQVLAWSGGPSAITALNLYMYTSGPKGTPVFSGSGAIIGLTICGDGTDPFAA